MTRAKDRSRFAPTREGWQGADDRDGDARAANEISRVDG
jgi:hypothetical protein